MPKRALIIGLGGTGKSCLTILKERLIETYGHKPDTVVLRTFDTDDLRDIDAFSGVRLSPSEFQHIKSPPGKTMHTVFADIASGRSSAYMYWLEKEKLDRILGPSERDIRGGAQQRRPLGRVALFLRWMSIYESIVDGIDRMYGKLEEELPADAVDIEKGKRHIFIVSSVAGGTGSGFLVDIANLVRHAIRSNTDWQSMDVSAIIVLPNAFRAHVPKMEDPTNLKPNSYAALRELDRFIRTHSAALPYMIRYDDDLRSITWSTVQPLDHVYLVDTVRHSANQDSELGGDPMQGVFPVIADFIMAHVDGSLGDSLATLRANAGQHYDKEEGWQYSSFNVMSYIFPVDDVIGSFSYRFLQEMLTRQFLPIADRRKRTLVEQEAVKETERVFAENSVGNRVNPGVIRKAIAATRQVDSETVDVSWPNLFNLIALSESAFAEDYQDLDQSLAYLTSSLIPTEVREYRHENYDEGYTRLLNFGEEFMDDFLGPQLDPGDEESRTGGGWDGILARYPDALRQRFAEALDAILLDVLNRRDPNIYIMEPFLLPYARAMVATLKERLVSFKALLEQEYREQQIDTRIRQTSEELRNAITWMYETKDSRRLIPIGKPAARKAQDAYISLLVEKMELVLHQRIYRTVLDILDALGAAEQDSAGRPSVLDVAAQELENWQATFQDVDRIIRDRARVHEGNRKAKRRIKVRRYLTDPQFEEQLYQQPEHSGMVAMHVMGQAQDTKGLTWQRLEEAEPLEYKLVTTWAEEAKGAEEIAHRFFVGVKDLFRVVRQNVTVADRVATEFASSASFVNAVGQVNEPFLRYHSPANGKPMFHERYVSLYVDKASDEARKFLEEAQTTLRNQGLNVDTAAESLVACTVAEVARGVRLGAVDQFVSCEPDYRRKLYPARESLHIFPEEQVAADYEGRIESLGEPDRSQRSLAPELVIAMGDEVKLKAFTLACAYGLIDQGLYLDPETGEETTELFLTLRQNGQVCRLPLSQRRLMRELDPRFDDVAGEEQLARLYLNALQNFVLKATEVRGVPHQMVSTLVEDLKGRGVSLGHIENPFTLSIRQVYEAIKQATQALGPDEAEEPNSKRRDALNARRHIEQHLQPFLDNRVRKFKLSPVPRVWDMGTVMHLILREEINSLVEETQSKAFPVILEYDTVLSMFSSLGRRQASGVIWVLPDDEGAQFHAEQEQHLLQICNHFGKLLRCPIQPPRLVNGLFVTEMDTTSFMEDVLFERPKISPRIPMIFSGWDTFGVEEASILSDSLQRFSPTQSIALLILFGKQHMTSHLQQVIADKMRAGHGTDTVLIGRQELEDVLGSPNPRSALRSFTLSRINIANISPYEITGPVVSDLVFSGREEELRTIAGKVGISSYVLIGGRRFGKTSVLLRLHRLRLPAAGFRTLYHDCATTPTYEAFFAATVYDWQPERPPDAPTVFGDLLQSPPTDEQLVLLLDETDKLIHADRADGWRLSNTLRALANSGRAQVVLSGERTLRDALHDSTSPLFNFPNEMLLHPLGFRAVEELVTRPMKQLEIELVDKIAVVRRIYDFTSGHPNIVQRLCHRLIERLNEQSTRRITLDDVEAIIENTDFIRKDFLETYFSRASTLEHLCAILMAADTNLRTLISVHEALAKSGVAATLNQVDAALERLVDLRSILDRTPKGYDFAVTAFPRIISKSKRISDWIALRREVFVHAGDIAPETASPELQGRLW